MNGYITVKVTVVDGQWGRTQLVDTNLTQDQRVEFSERVWDDDDNRMFLADLLTGMERNQMVGDEG